MTKNFPSTRGKEKDGIQPRKKVKKKVEKKERK